MSNPKRRNQREQTIAPVTAPTLLGWFLTGRTLPDGSPELEHRDGTRAEWMDALRARLAASVLATDDPPPTTGRPVPADDIDEDDPPPDRDDDPPPF